MRLLGAFLVRDFFIESSYRVSFFATIAGALFRALVFFFLSQLINDAAVPFLREYQGDYFSFVIIGIAFGGYFSVGLTGFARALRQAQTTGTLEAMMMTPAPVSWIIVGSAGWSYAFTSLRVLIYLLFGSLLLGLNLGEANYLAALTGLVLSIVSFASIGILAASIIMVIKRGDPVTGFLSGLASLVGGVYYPVEILPQWLQLIANMLPITYALRVMRLTLLQGASWSDVSRDLLVLAVFCLVVFPVSLMAFRFAIERARADGSLAHY